MQISAGGSGYIRVGNKAKNDKYMDKALKSDTIFIFHDSNVKLIIKGNEINIVPNRIDTQAITLQNEQIKVIIAKIPESQPMITDWLAAIGTILAVVLSLVFSGLALLKTKEGI